jgi:hypothetical protein
MDVLRERDQLLQEFGPDFLVTDHWPRLWFDDIHHYAASKIRVVTVGINPSGRDFHKDSKKFNRTAVELSRACQEDWLKGQPKLDKYHAYLTSFFESGRPEAWFSGYRHVLRAAGVDYNCSSSWKTKAFPKLETHPNGSALHTDICSPYATGMWSKLSKDEKERLLESGPAFFDRLLEVLRPNFLLMSVSKANAERTRYFCASAWSSGARCWCKHNCLVVVAASSRGPLRTVEMEKREELGCWIATEGTPISDEERKQQANFDVDDFADLGHNDCPLWLEDRIDSETAVYDPLE